MLAIEILSHPLYGSIARDYLGCLSARGLPRGGFFLCYPNGTIEAHKGADGTDDVTIVVRGDVPLTSIKRVQVPVCVVPRKGGHVIRRDSGKPYLPPPDRYGNFY